MNAATATWVYEGTRSDTGAPRERAPFGLLSDSFTVTSSSTAVAGIAGVSHVDWNANAVTHHARKGTQWRGTSGLLWLVWSGGTQEKPVDALFVGLTSEASRQAKAESAKKILRQWLEVPAEERANQSRNLATLIERLNEERGTARKLFR